MTESTILTATGQTSTLASPDITVNLASPLTFSSNSRQYIRLIKVSISSRIPNIYQIASPGQPAFNNGLIRISNDGSATWSSIQLPNGVYSLPMIEAAVNDVASGLTWWLDNSDPGYKIRYNLATNIVYVTLDSTKLAHVGQLGIDFSQSRIDEVLGYNNPANQTFIIDGTHGADSNAELDWFGNNLSLQIHGFSHLSIKDGVRSEEIASIPLSAASSSNEIVYPINGIYCPIIPLQTTLRQLVSYIVRFRGSRIDPITGAAREIYILDGCVDCTFELLWR